MSNMKEGFLQAKLSTDRDVDEVKVMNSEDPLCYDLLDTVSARWNYGTTGPLLLLLLFLILVFNTVVSVEHCLPRLRLLTHST